MENIKRILPEMAKKATVQHDDVDLRKLDTKVILDYADSTSDYLKHGKISPDIRKGLFKSDFLK